MLSDFVRVSTQELWGNTDFQSRTATKGFFSVSLFPAFLMGTQWGHGETPTIGYQLPLDVQLKGILVALHPNSSLRQFSAHFSWTLPALLTQKSCISPSSAGDSLKSHLSLKALLFLTFCGCPVTLASWQVEENVWFCTLFSFYLLL